MRSYRVDEAPVVQLLLPVVRGSARLRSCNFRRLAGALLDETPNTLRVIRLNDKLQDPPERVG
jgi:hypothetical protein